MESRSCLQITASFHIYFVCDGKWKSWGNNSPSLESQHLVFYLSVPLFFFLLPPSLSRIHLLCLETIQSKVYFEFAQNNISFSCSKITAREMDKQGCWLSSQSKWICHLYFRVGERLRGGVYRAGSWKWSGSSEIVIFLNSIHNTLIYVVGRWRKFILNKIYLMSEKSSLPTLKFSVTDLRFK